jgi:tetratricopeptide (TPR) repeat protein
VWIASAGLIVVGLALLARAGRPALLVIGAGLLLLIAGYLAYLVRHIAFVRKVSEAEAALDAGDLERARAILAPMLDRFSGMAVVERAAGLTTYALGDPLAAASLLERAARSFRDDEKLAATLVASYAALNRGGDARRAAALAPRAVDVRLALAWSELVALGGDRAQGAAMAVELQGRADVGRSAARRAMTALLLAVASAHEGDAASVRASIGRASADRALLPPYDRAFLGYLEGVALRELGRIDDARRAFEAAMEPAPGTIGEALARRELANLIARLSADAAAASDERPHSSSSQPSAD